MNTVSAFFRLILIATSLLPAMAEAKVIYVDSAVSSNADLGLSWNTAHRSLARGLQNALPGDSVRVAKGTYFPDVPATGRSKGFVVRAGVVLEGGYRAGSLERDFTASRTILSGDVDRNDTYANGVYTHVGNNALHVLRDTLGWNTTHWSRLDGLEIQGGNANETGSDANGGGLFSESTRMSLKNCKVRFNHATTYGGGAYLGWADTLRMADCQFLDNRAVVGFGGGFAGGYLKSSLSERCLFQRNASADDGGAWRADGDTIRFVECQFLDGMSAREGGAIKFRGKSLSVADSRFENNSAGTWAGGLRMEGHLLSVVRSSFAGNRAVGEGGGITYNGQRVDIADSRFERNKASHGGGARLYVDTTYLTGTRFYRDSAMVNGGSLLLGSDTAWMNDLVFQESWANESGGGFFGGSTVSNQGIVMRNVLFRGNSAVSGGGIAHDVGWLDLGAGSLFHDNRASRRGGAIALVMGGNARMRLARFVGNLADSGGAYASRDGAILVADSLVFTGNTARLGGAMYMGNGESQVVTRSGFYGNRGNSGGAVAFAGYTRARFDLTTFQGNIARVGGVVAEAGVESVFDRCLFQDNQAFSASVGHGVNATFRNSLFTGNSANMGILMQGIPAASQSQFPGPRLLYSTLAGNHQGRTIDPLLQSIGLQAEGLLIWGNASNLWSGSQGTVYSLLADFQPGAGNQAGNPLFLSGTAGDYRLSAASPAREGGRSSTSVGAQLPWPPVDTAGLDLAGNPRLVGPRLDIGAYEFTSGTGLPLPPRLTSAWDSLRVPSGDTLVLSLDSLSAGEGYYARYPGRSLSDLAFQVMEGPAGVSFRIDPVQRLLVVVPPVDMAPGQIFSFVIRASDRDRPEIAAERMARVEVTYADYDLGVPRMSQDDTGVVNLALPARRNVFPLRLQGTWPALLLGTANPATVDLKTLPRLSGAAWIETLRPASRGGSQEWGEYGARFRPESVTVISSAGKSLGNLRQVLLASATFRRDRKLRLLLPVSDSLGAVRRVYVETVLDFSDPVTTLRVASLEPHRAGLAWTAFDRPLVSLTLVLEATGSGQDPLRLDLPPGAVQTVLDSLLDSQKYRAVLEAVDRKGNRGLSVLDFATPSGLYVLSGGLEGVSTAPGTKASIRLFEISGATRLLLREDSVTVGLEYRIPGVRNGQYAIAYAAAGYAAVPAERLVTVFRSDVPGLDVRITPPDLVDTNGVVVRQIPGDGDLEFLVRARKLYPGEEPAQLVLNWLAGEDSANPGTMTFDVRAESATSLPDGGTLWTLRLPGSLVRDSILPREPGFAGKVRYLDARLITRTAGFSHFREGRWHYPHLKTGEALYAPQTFTRPAAPIAGVPRMLENDAVMSLRAAGSGPSLRANVTFTRLSDNHASQREFEAQDAVGVTLAATVGGTQVGFLARRLLFQSAADHLSPSGAPVPLTGYQARGNEAVAVGAFQGQPMGPMADRATRPSMAAGFRIPKAGSYWIYAYVERAAAVKGYVYVSVGDRATSTLHAIPVPRNAAPGWYAQETRTLSQDMGKVSVGFPSLDTGYQAVHLFAPSQNISVAALALAPRIGGASVAPLPPVALLQRAPFVGEPRSIRADGFGLETDRYYRMDAYLVDRYGNRSDTVSLDSLRTVDDLFDGRLTLHQDTGTGDLVLGLNPTARILTGGRFEDNRVVLTQLSVAGGGATHRINLRKTLNAHEPTEVVLPRSLLPDAMKTSPHFVRHAGYRPLSMDLELRHDYPRTTRHSLNCPVGAEGDACRETCTIEGGASCACTEKWVLGWPLFSKYSDCSWTTRDSASFPLGKYTRSGHWPPQTGDVASQEFRIPVEPRLDSVSLSSRKAVLAVRNLDDGGGLGVPVTSRRQQMSGMLSVTWEPGSLCTRSTTVEIPFGNRFVVNGGQAAFVPSFDGSVATRVGPWRRNALGHRARHQWLDAYSPGDSTRGGGFLPDLGDSITLAEMQTQSPEVWPRISTGVRVPAAEVSRDNSLAESYRLFVLPGGINGATSHRFTFGLDGRPLLDFEASAENYDTLHTVWLPGPRVWLDSGAHTVDLFMRDDGVRIAGVALMKGDALPNLTRQQLNRFGEEGFDLSVVADQLQPATKTSFTAVARDRYGNKSQVARRDIVTKPLRSLIPGVVVTPHRDLENGFHPGGAPGFTFTLEHESEDSLDLSVSLRMFDRGASMGIALPPLTRVSPTVWSIQIDSATPLSSHPREFDAVNDSNGYALVAFAFKPALTGPPAPGDSGSMSRLNFGVKPDTAGNPFALHLVDPTYTLKGPVHLTVARAVAHGDTLKADMSVGMLPEHPAHLNRHLMLEGVTALCDTVYDDSGNLWYKNIRSIDTRSGRFAAYQCGTSGDDCVRIPNFGLPSGRFWSEVSPDSLRLVQLPDSSYALEARGTRVLDDDGSRTRASASPTLALPLRFNSEGYLDTLFIQNDFFLLHNVLGATTEDSATLAAPPHLLARVPISGFTLRSCKTKLWSERLNDTNQVHHVRVAGECEACGPHLSFQVKAPGSQDTAFQVLEPMDRAIRLSYWGFLDPYRFDFSRIPGGPGDTAAFIRYPQGRKVDYAGWDLRLEELAFNARGVHLTSLDAALPLAAFPPGTEGPVAFARNIQGLRIANPAQDLARGLQILGLGVASSGQGPWVNTQGYRFQGLARVTLSTDSTTENLRLKAEGGTLRVPVADAPGSLFIGPDSATTTLDSMSITPEGIDALEAEGELEGELGHLDNGDATFKVHGDLRLHMVENVLIADLDSLPGQNLLALNQDVTLDAFIVADIPVQEAGLSFAGDFSLRTVSGFIPMGGEANFVPRNFPWLRFPSQAIALTQGDGRLQLGLLEPSVTFRLGPEPRLFDSTRTQVVLDQNLRLVAFAGRGTLPQGGNSLSDIPGLRGVTGSLGDISLEEYFLGYSDHVGEERVELGASAQIRLGGLFRPLGLEDRRVRIAWLQVSRTTDSTAEKPFNLDTLRARAFDVPERFAIGPRNFGGSGDEEYVEFHSSGDGLEFDYAEGEFAARMRGFGLRLTQDFPIESLRGLRLLLREFEIRKGLSDPHPRVTSFAAVGRWAPPGGVLDLGSLTVRGAQVTAGYDTRYSGAAHKPVIDSSQGRRDTVFVTDSDTANRTGMNAYLEIAFSSLEMGGKTLDLSCNGSNSSIRVYFDGSLGLDLKVRLRDTIPVYPFDNPDVFVLPPDTGSCMTLTSKGTKVEVEVKDLTLKSRNSVPGLGKPLDCPFSGLLTIDPVRGRFVPERFRTACAADVEFMTTPFKVGLDSIVAGFTDGDSVPRVAGTAQGRGKHFYLAAAVKAEFDSVLQAVDTASLVATAGFVGPLANPSSLNFSWRITGYLKANLAGWPFTAENVLLSPDTIGFGKVSLSLEKLKEYGLIPCGKGADSLFIALEDVYWRRQGSTWLAPSVNPEIAGAACKFEFDLLGNTVGGTVDGSRLFTIGRPRIVVRDVELTLTKSLGGATLPTGFALALDGKAPYLHPEFDMPQKLKVSIPSIKLGDKVQLAGAVMELGIERRELKKKKPSKTIETWYFRGKASLGLPGAVEGLTVDLSLEKPNPPENVTGIRHAKVILKLSKGARIPIGTTPFYITAFMGALYDGYGEPEGQKICRLPSMAPGLKLEAKAYIEFEQPDVAKGDLGFWTHLRELNFGVNGTIEALSGYADAKACLALYDRGRAFHGNFEVRADLGVSLNGELVIDIWNDGRSNLTAQGNATVGVKKGLFFKRWWLKIPPFSMDIGGAYAKLGRFENGSNGYTTGIRVVGRNYGLGIIGSSFVIGGTDKYKLKQPPSAGGAPAPKRSALAKASAAPAATATAARNPFLGLAGDEVISVIAATDNGDTPWPQDAIKIQTRGTNGAYTTDDDLSHYLPVDRPVDQSGDGERKENLLLRTWLNALGRKTDSIRILLPVPTTSQDQFDFQVNVSLHEPKPQFRLRIDTVTAGADPRVKAVFSGASSHTQGALRVISRYDSAEARIDTVLKQKMAPEFFAVRIRLPRGDARNQEAYKASPMPIPIASCDGYQPGHESLLDNPFVQFDVDSRTVYVRELTCDITDFPEGEYKFLQSIELFDYIVNGAEGKRVLPDTDRTEVLRLNLTPDTLSGPGGEGVTWARGPYEKPIPMISGLVGTGSALAQNARGEDERRTVFLAWKAETHPHLSGYQIFWSPAGRMGDTGYTRMAEVGPTSHFAVTLPDIDSAYTNSCLDARHAGDTTAVATSCAGAVRNPDFYAATALDVAVVPLTDNVEKRPVYPDADTPSVFVPVSRPLWALADTVRNVALGVNAGSAKHPLRVSLIQGGRSLATGDTVTVPQSEALSLPAILAVGSLDTSGAANPSDYAELFAEVLGPDGHSAPDSVRMAWPASAFGKSPLPLIGDSVPLPLVVTPVAKTKRCREVFAATCNRLVGDDMGNIIDSKDVCMAPSCEESADSLACDPNYARNTLPVQSPCDGDPDAIIQRATPPGVYTLRVYAQNNGRRSEAVQQGGGYGASVKDSFFVRVLPPRPVLHTANLEYWRQRRDDTLILSASNLLETVGGGSVSVRVRSGAQMADFTPTFIRENATGGAGRQDVGLSLLGLTVNAPNGATLDIRLVNKMGEEVESNALNAQLIIDAQRLECNPITALDSVNAEYAVDFLGNFPLKPAIDLDDPTKNDTITFRFTNLFDRNALGYAVKIQLTNGDSIPVPFLLEEDGIRFKLPSGLDPSQQYRFVANYLIDNSRCNLQNWGLFTTRNLIRKAPIQIRQDQGKVFVVPSAYLRTRNVDIREVFGLGKNAQFLPVNLNSTEPAIVLTKPGYVEIRVTDADGHNAELHQFWIEISSRPPVARVNDSTLRQQSTLVLGNPIQIPKSEIEAYPPGGAVSITCWREGNGPRHCGDTLIVLDLGRHCQLLLETGWVRTLPTGQKDTLITASTPYCIDVVMPLGSMAVTLPGSRLLKVGANLVRGETVLLPLDSALAVNPALRMDSLQFISPSGRVLSHVSDSLAGMGMRQVAWVRMDSMPLGNGDFTLTLAPGQGHSGDTLAFATYRAAFKAPVQGIYFDRSPARRHVPVAGGLTANLPMQPGDLGLGLSTWIRYAPSAISQGGADIFRYTLPGGKAVALRLLPGGQVLSQAGTAEAKSLPEALEPTLWHHIALDLSFEAGREAMSLYLNGLRVASVPVRQEDLMGYGQGTLFLAQPTELELRDLLVQGKPLNEDVARLHYFSERPKGDFLKPIPGQTTLQVLTAGYRLRSNLTEGGSVFGEASPWRFSELDFRLLGLSYLVGNGGNIQLKSSGRAVIYLLREEGEGSTPPSGYSAVLGGCLAQNPLTGAVARFQVFRRDIAAGSHVLSRGPANAAWPLLYAFDAAAETPDIEVGALPPFALAYPLTEGLEPFADREAAISSLPTPWRGSVLLQGFGSEKADTSASYLAFTLGAPGRIGVLYDSAATSIPDFLSGFTPGASVRLDNGQSLKLFEASLPAGETILPGPRSRGASGNAQSYAVVLKAGSGPCVIAGPGGCVPFDTATVLYSDHSTRARALSSFLRGATLARTRQGDFARTDAVAFPLTLTRSQAVYIALDSATTQPPTFLPDGLPGTSLFLPVGGLVRNDSGGSYRLYRAFLPAGTFRLSGARSGGDVANRWNYLVLATDPAAALDSTLVQRPTRRPYADRQDLVLVQVPPTLADLPEVKGNSSSSGCGTKTLSLPTPVRLIAALHPGWAKVFAAAGWVRQEDVVRWNLELPDYVLYGKDFASAPVTVPLWPCGEPAVAPPAPIVFVEVLEHPRLGLKANSLKVHGIGESRETLGPTLSLRNLDVTYLPRQALTSASFRLFASLTPGEAVPSDTLVLWSPFADTVLTRVVGGVPQPLSKQTVKVRKHLALADLSPTLMDADSVFVDAYDLSAQGKVRLELTNKGGEDVAARFRIVLFEDLDGDFTFDPAEESSLGEATVRGLAAGEALSLAMRLSGKVRFPGKTFLAVIDADQVVVESKEENNALASRGVCAGFTASAFTTTQGLAHPRVVEARRAGRAHVVGVLTDDNQDGVVDAADHPVLVEVRGGEVEAVDLTTGAVRWTMSLPARLAPQAVRLADLKGTGSPSLLVGDGVLSSTGKFMLNATVCTGEAGWSGLDFNGDRVTDRMSCEEGVFTLRDGQSGKVLKDGESQVDLASLPVLPAPCFDAVLAYPRIQRSAEDAWLLTVRVGNAGGKALLKGLGLKAEDGSGHTVAEARTSTDLLPDEDLEVTLNLGRRTKGDRIKVQLDAENRYLEAREDNNTLLLELKP